jgi:GNAT superfamily N-acetyltransferase
MWEVRLRVRQADIADLEKLALLFDGYRQFYGEQSDLKRAENFLRDRFEQQQSTVFLAFSEEEPVGFTQLFPSFSSTRTARIFILNDIFVAPQARGKGYAKSLLAAACDYGRSVGAVRLSLSTAIDNHVAQDLYEGAGWVRDDQFHVYSFSLI